MSAQVASSTPSILGKRRRVDGTESTHMYQGPAQSSLQWADPKLVRCERLWFDDGNIVIRVLAKSPQPSHPPTVYAFKCHRSVLSRNSDFFRAMFELPQAVEGQPTVDGVPCVDFMDDFEDLRDLLLLVYGVLDAPQGPDPGCEFNPLPAISGPLQLTMKYDMRPASELLCDTLEGLWPETWVGFTAKEKWMHRQAKGHTADPHAQWPDPACVLLFAERFNVKKILRSAWYDIVRFYSPGLGPCGRRDEDADQLRQTVDLHLLQDEHMRRLIMGRERLRDTLTRNIDWLDECIIRFRKARPGYQCNCMDILGELWIEATTSTRLLDMLRDPLGELLKLEAHVWNLSALQADRSERACNCSHMWLEARIRGVADEMWQSLPEMFEFKV